jgi:hypothetical protein
VTQAEVQQQADRHHVTEDDRVPGRGHGPQGTVATEIAPRAGIHTEYFRQGSVEQPMLEELEDRDRHQQEYPAHQRQQHVADVLALRTDRLAT